MKKIIIESGSIRLDAELNDSETAKAIAGILPISGTANVWGDEIYFSLPIHIDEADDARQEVEEGTLAFWPVGDAFCIFFGPTPVSISEKPRAYSPVNVFGKTLGDATVLKQVNNGEQLTIKEGVFYD